MPLFLVFSAKVGTMGFTPLVLNVRAWRHCLSLGLLASGPSQRAALLPQCHGKRLPDALQGGGGQSSPALWKLLLWAGVAFLLHSCPAPWLV